MMRKLLYSFLFFIILHAVSFGQCTSYPTGFTTSQISTDQTFCFDNNTSMTVNNVPAQRYVVLNVISGFTYTFSVGNIWNTTGGSDIEYLAVFNDATGNAFLAGSPSNNNGATITWKSNFSGKIRILLLRGYSCASTTSTSTGTITMTLNSVGNDLDDQTIAGTDVWRGHIYNWSSATLPPGGTSPAAPASTTPFTSAEYAGYYDMGSETIPVGYNFGGDGACLNVFSNNTQRASIYTETFAVRYRMKSNRAAGCYLVTVRGDDGVRLYADNVRVLMNGNNSLLQNMLIYWFI